MTIWFVHISRQICKVTDLKPEYVTHCSSTAAVVAQTHFTVTLHIHYIAFRLCLNLIYFIPAIYGSFKIQLCCVSCCFITNAMGYAI
jgi:hypothetical protein